VRVPVPKGDQIKMHHMDACPKRVINCEVQEAKAGATIEVYQIWIRIQEQIGDAMFLAEQMRQLEHAHGQQNAPGRHSEIALDAQPADETWRPTGRTDCGQIDEPIEVERALFWANDSKRGDNLPSWGQCDEIVGTLIELVQVRDVAYVFGVDTAHQLQCLVTLFRVCNRERQIVKESYLRSRSRLQVRLLC